jgi:hypothetical protein
VRRLIAKWNGARNVWERKRTRACGHSALFSETWPTSGMMLGGVAYELPTWEPLTSGSGSSSSPGLGTPKARDWKGPTADGFCSGDLHDSLQQAALLPTVKSSDGRRGNSPSELERNTPGLVAIGDLLPTPAAAELASSLELTCSGDGRERPNKLGWAVAEAILPTPTAWMAKAGDRSRSGNRTGLPGIATEATKLLPTVRASDGEKGSPGQQQKGMEALPAAAYRALPTPVAVDAKGVRNATAERSPDSRVPVSRGTTMADALVPLPTPVASRRGAGQHPDKRAAGGHQVSLQDVATTLPAEVDWGIYAPAVRAAELVAGRPAPPPTELNRLGNAQLSPRFVEWLMLLPEGWVTDPSIWEGMSGPAARREQIRMLGNGVVPAQAAKAVDLLLESEEEVHLRDALARAVGKPSRRAARPSTRRRSGSGR